MEIKFECYLFNGKLVSVFSTNSGKRGSVLLNTQRRSRSQSNLLRCLVFMASKDENPASHR